MLITVQQTIGALHSGETIQLRHTPDAVWLQSRLYPLERHNGTQAQCFSLMVHWNVLRLALGPTWRPPEINLAVAPSPALLDLEVFAGIKVNFNGRHNAIEIPRSLLSQRLHRPVDPYCLRSQATFEALLHSSPSPDFAIALQQLIQSLLPRGYPDITQAAAAAGMSVRSLQRRLTATGLSYSRLVEQVRLELAMQYLQDPHLKLIDIAMALGYNDTGNFTRAFKRWTSLSPRQFRRNQMSKHCPN